MTKSRVWPSRWKNNLGDIAGQRRIDFLVRETKLHLQRQDREDLGNLLEELAGMEDRMLRLLVRHDMAAAIDAVAYAMDCVRIALKENKE